MHHVVFILLQQARMWEEEQEVNHSGVKKRRISVETARTLTKSSTFDDGSVFVSISSTHTHSFTNWCIGLTFCKCFHKSKEELKTVTFVNLFLPQFAKSDGHFSFWV